MADVSVIIPMFNAERFLPSCLATIRRNYSEGTQFIVVDDGSTDETPRLLDRAAAELPYLTVLRNPQNVGVARSRNIAFTHVERRYLTFLDVDDWYAPGHLDALVEAIERLGADFVRTNHVRSEGVKRTLVRSPSKSRNEVVPASRCISLRETPSIVNYPFLWAGIYDTRRIPAELFQFNVSLRTAADRPWFWRLYMSSSTTANVDLDGYFYRKDPNPAALTQAGNAHTLHFLDASRETRDLVLARGEPEFTAVAAHGICRTILFHIERRARLDHDLQHRLYTGSRDLLLSFPADVLEATLDRFSLPSRLVLRRLIGMKER